MLGRVFRYQGWLWRALNTLTDIMALSVLWFLLSLPVLTLGAAYYVALVVPLGAACWVFPTLSRCALGFGALNATALKLAVGHLPSTVILVLMTAELARLSVRWLYPLAFMPAVMMLLWSLFTEPVFKKHGAGISAPEEEDGAGAPDSGE